MPKPMVVKNVNALDLPEMAKSFRKEPGQKMFEIDPESFELKLDFNKYPISEGSRQVVRELIKRGVISVVCRIEFEPTKERAAAKSMPAPEPVPSLTRWLFPFRRDRPNVAV